jgi:hypothetical protein
LYPESKNIFADLVAKNTDIDFQETLIERMKMLLPPEVIAKETGQPPPQPAPDPMGQIMQAQIMLQQKDLAIKEQQNQLNMQKLELEKEMLARKSQSEIRSQLAEEEKAKMNYEASLLSSMAKISSSRASEDVRSKRLLDDIYRRTRSI